MLATGTPAPDFTLPNGPGTEVAWPTCCPKARGRLLLPPRLQLGVHRRFCRRPGRLVGVERRLNASVVGISVNTPFVVAQWKQELGLPHC